MNLEFIIGLLYNIAILLSFSMLYDYIWVKDDGNKSLFVKVVTGVGLGGIVIVIMVTPWTLYPGLVFDTRSIMLSVTGLFFGAIPTVCAMIVAGIYRIYSGGDGMWMGLAVIFSSGIIGILWGRFRFTKVKKQYVKELLALGIIVHIAMLICTVFLPTDSILSTLKEIALPVLIIYPLVSMVLGYLLITPIYILPN